MQNCTRITYLYTLVYFYLDRSIGAALNTWWEIRRHFGSEQLWTLLRQVNSNQIQTRSIPSKGLWEGSIFTTPTLCVPLSKQNPVGGFPKILKQAHWEVPRKIEVYYNQFAQMIVYLATLVKLPCFPRLHWVVHLANSTGHLKNKSYPASASPSNNCCLPVCCRCFTRTLRMKSWLLLPCRTTWPFLKKKGPMVVWSTSSLGKCHFLGGRQPETFGNSNLLF